ncbi:MAG: 4Fe-4S binding protein [Bacteroidales bacterium]|nr:4Fe-4S binding protein [Bacteroidales bacterium]MDD3201850.1 4Fe-4S binding protein [Bacteroidales bacterium]
MSNIRQIIKIDEELCNGCGACVNGCHEGALQLIDGKARMISDLYCDGLGACIGDCPMKAISFEEREAVPYDEVAVMKRIAEKGEATILAHLKHLKSHGEMEYVHQGVEYLKSNKIPVDIGSIESQLFNEEKPLACGCPGNMEHSFVAPAAAGNCACDVSATSQLTHWPVQLHLMNPQAGYFREADIVLAADCTAFAFADFHNRFIRNHKITIACPKLDSNKESYISKLTELIDSAMINTLTVVIMEVPCCGGLLMLANKAVEQAKRKVPVKVVIIGLQGEIKEEKWQ